MSEEQLLESVVYGGNIAKVTITTRIQLTVGLNKPVTIEYNYDQRRRYLSLIIKDYNHRTHPHEGWLDGGELKLGDQFRLDATTNIG